jgi:hypothetical protein
MAKLKFCKKNEFNFCLIYTFDAPAAAEKIANIPDPVPKSITSLFEKSSLK